MALGIVLLDMLEFRGVVEGWQVPVEVTQPAVNGWEAGADVFNVALEVLHVDWVEANDCCVQAYVDLGQLRAEPVWTG